MKIYTKSGDTGSTSLTGGKRVKKSDRRIEAYGTVDELIAHIAYLRDLVPDMGLRIFLLHTMDRAMSCAAILSTERNGGQLKLPKIYEADVDQLEAEIDRMSVTLPSLHSFVLPGGSPASSYCHVVRTVCRRAERTIVMLAEDETVPEIILKYINRLSDYFFVLSRMLLFECQIVETKWTPSFD